MNYRQQIEKQMGSALPTPPMGKRWRMRKSKGKVIKWLEDIKKHNALYNKYKEKGRRKIYAYYGNKCNCCSEEEREFFVIDHINGGGIAHLKSLNTTLTTWLCSQLVKYGRYPKGFQLLCSNCNLSKMRHPKENKCIHQLN